jgi:hypothetical protein
MNRYSSTNIIRETNKKRRFGTTIYPNIPITDNDVYIRTTSPERLDNLAYTFYKNTEYWWIIAQANNIGKGSLIVPENTLLRIPDESIIKELLISTNNNR